MGERREIMTEIVSLATGIPQDRLEEFEPLKRLLEAADKPGEEEVRYDFGLLTFRWPCEGNLLLSIVNCWASASHRLQELEGRYWAYRARPIPVFAQFALGDGDLERVKREEPA